MHNCKCVSCAIGTVCEIVHVYGIYTDKKWNKIFLTYKEIQSGAVAKSYMRKGFLIYEKVRKYFPINEEAVSHIWLCNCSNMNFLIYVENLIFFFNSVEIEALCNYAYLF